MKKILFIALVLIVGTVNAQRKWAVELGVGNHTIADEVADLRDNFLHLDGVVRYSFNEKFGVGVYGGYDRLSLENYLTGAEANTDYFRASLEGVVDVTEVANLGNNTFALFAHGGFGASYFNTDKDYDKLLPNLSGGLTGLFKLTQSVALKADWTTTAHFNQGATLDGSEQVTNVGINSFINNATVGVIVYFGKKKSDSGEHYDWYKESKVDELTTVRKKIRDLHNAVIAKPQVVNVYKILKDCECSLSENVYFENDLPKVGQAGEDLIGIQGLNAIDKVAKALLLDPKLTVKLTGSASPTKSTPSEYDLDLSKRRVLAVRNKLELLNIDPSRFRISYFGKDRDRDDIHEFARKVSLDVE